MQIVAPLFRHATFKPSAHLYLSTERVYQLRVSSTTACDYLRISRPHFLGEGLHLDFGTLQRSKLVYFGKTQIEMGQQRPIEIFKSLAGRCSSRRATVAPEIEARSLCGVRGCRRQQSQATRNDSRDVCLNSKLASSSNLFFSQNRGTMVTSPKKKPFHRNSTNFLRVGRGLNNVVCSSFLP